MLRCRDVNEARFILCWPHNGLSRRAPEASSHVYLKLAFNPAKLWFSISVREYGFAFRTALQHGGAQALGPSRFDPVLVMTFAHASASLRAIFGSPRRRLLGADLSWRMHGLADLHCVRLGVLDFLYDVDIDSDSEIILPQRLFECLAALTDMLNVLWARGHPRYARVMHALPDAMCEASCDAVGDEILAHALRHGAFGVCPGLGRVEASGWLSPLTLDNAHALVERMRRAMNAEDKLKVLKVLKA